MHANDFRRIVLGLEGAVEGAHMGHPDFRVKNRIFATLHRDQQFGMVKLTPDQQAQLTRDYPDAFTPETGAWGRSGYTRVRLAAVQEDIFGEAATLAWQNIVNGGAPTRSRSTRSPRGTPRSRTR